MISAVLFISFFDSFIISYLFILPPPGAAPPAGRRGSLFRDPLFTIAQ